MKFSLYNHKEDTESRDNRIFAGGEMNTYHGHDTKGVANEGA